MAPSDNDNGHDDPSIKSAANRTAPIPLIPLPEELANDNKDADKKYGKRDFFRSAADKIKDHLPDGQALQERILDGLMSQIIPAEDWKHLDNPDEDEASDKKGSKKDQDKSASSKESSLGGLGGPDFGPRTMAVNVRRFTQRVGILFGPLEGIILLLSWHNRTQTWSLLAVYSLLCLKPHLIAVLPFSWFLLVALLPAFLERHPAPANDPRLEPSFYGPATAPPSRLRPAADLSKDFWRNARDLQNSMEDFSRAHDAANDYIEPLVNFSDEATSSTLFVGAFILTCLVVVLSPFIPWKAGALVVGWVAIGSLHPSVQAYLASSTKNSSLSAHLEDIQTLIRNWIESDIFLDEPPQLRQVEIFELQKHHDDDSWEPWLYSPSPFNPLSASRLAGNRPRGTQFFEDVQAPAGWRWKEKKWALDLLSREWVEQRMITRVEIETDGDRWVYDIPPSRAEPEKATVSHAKSRSRQNSAPPKSGWEETTATGERGEWRRRRWTRLVEKRPVARLNGE